MNRNLVVAVALLAMVACGGTEEVNEGDSCEPSGAIECASGSQALFCQSGTAVKMNCRGPGGCTADQDQNKGICDNSRALASDFCPNAQEGQGQCDVSNPDQLLKCTGNAWTAQPCKGCFLQGANVMCQQ